MQIRIHDSLARDFSDTRIRYFWQNGTRHSRSRGLFRNFSNILRTVTPSSPLLGKLCPVGTRQYQLRLRPGLVCDRILACFIFEVRHRARRRSATCLKRCAFTQRGREHGAGQHEIDCGPCIWAVFKFLRERLLRHGCDKATIPSGWRWNVSFALKTSVQRITRCRHLK